MFPADCHPKRIGEWVELQFMARAFFHGLTVFKPWGDSGRYDIVVEHKGRFYRVQVKCTTWHDGHAYLANTRSRGPYEKNSGRPYTPKQIDFFAFFIIPEDIWYIVPIAELTRAKYAVYLNPHDSHNRYFRYMEAWHLLKAHPKRRSDLAARPAARLEP